MDPGEDLILAAREILDEKALQKAREDAERVKIISVETSFENEIFAFLRHCFSSVISDTVFEEKIKERLLETLDKANFNQLVRLLLASKTTKSSLVQQILSPFTSRDGSPLLDRESKKPTENKDIKTSPEDLHALEELTFLISKLEEIDKKNKSKESESEKE